MHLMENIINNIWIQRLFWSALVVLISFLIYRIVSKILAKKEQKSSKILSTKKNKTLIRMFKSIVAGALSIITVLTVLEIFGINVTSMLAGVGIAGIIIGVALQDSLKDIIRGFVIISDNYYEMGDVIKFGENVGVVESVSLLTTKIRDINTQNTVSIANRNIDKVEVDPGYIYIQVPFSYDVKVSQAESALEAIVKELQRHKDITNVKYQGLNKIGSSSLDYQIVITTDPTSRLQIRRDALRVIVTTLESLHLSIPYEQLDIHSK